MSGKLIGREINSFVEIIVYLTDLFLRQYKKHPNPAGK